MDKTLTAKQKLKLLYLLSGIFIAMNLIGIYFEFFLFPLIPVFIFFGLIAFLSMDILLLIIVFFTPLAINLNNIGGGFGLSLPTEPLMFGAMLLFFFKLFTSGKFDKNILKHPITIAIIFNLVWIGVTSLTSSMPIVSLKFFVSRLWFVICFYFLATQLFRKFNNIKLFYWLYIIPFLIVIFYTLIHHAQFGFQEKQGHWVMTPFYNDHTSYGALLAMFIPFLVYYSFFRGQIDQKRQLTYFVLCCFIVAIILSYTRAAWISLALALIVLLLVKIKIKMPTVIVMLFATLVILFVFKDSIYETLVKNKKESSSNFSDHLKSMSNISTDASNLERLNRWKSAWRMFLVHPIVGWGPGTYAFKYAPFQLHNEKTIISTNAGDMGNAHSEYIGPLAEEGLFGILSFIAIFIVVSVKSIRLYYRTKDKEIKNLILVTYLGLFTYFVHGYLNNFLDTDKAAVPFWGFIAIITSLEIYHKNKLEGIESEKLLLNKKD